MENESHMRWRFLPRLDRDIFRQLAMEETQARLAAQNQHANTIRFWKSHKSVVMGRLQCVHKEANIEYCRGHNISIARRFTGGGTVYHDEGNLNFSLCMLHKDSAVPKRLMEVYNKFIGLIASSLNKIKIPVRYDENRNCLRINEKKVTGTAGWIKQGVSFVHGTLLLTSDLEEMKKALTPVAGQQEYLRDFTRVRCKESNRDTVTNVSDEIERCPSMESIIQAIIQGIEEMTNETVEEMEFTREEVDTAQSLYDTRYRNVEWNIGTPKE
jgi:lipoate-protein ligase A